MNCYEYRIYDTVFDDMSLGRKKIEFRLLNDKSKNIKIGDMIKFKVLNNEENYILAEVTNKYIYENVDNLWNHKEVLTSALNYTKQKFKLALYEIFGKDNVESSKIVGIEFTVKEIHNKIISK